MPSLVVEGERRPPYIEPVTIPGRPVAGNAQLPGRPWDLLEEARRTLGHRRATMPSLGGRSMAVRLLDEIKEDVASALAKARADSKLVIAGAITDLVKEFSDGTKQVERAIQAEALEVRDEFSGMVGNAHGDDDDDKDKTK